MSAQYDLVLRRGSVLDGTGRLAFQADVAIQNGRIAALGAIGAPGREEIDARGYLVTPGFVDIHTHYDGHATWANRLGPSSDHGVTTIVMGNCGVGFAPCRPEDRARLIRLMEGVEDIPEVVMSAGLPWNWESFPSYLDKLATRQFDMDVATYLPHAPLRVYVMGERAAAREAATSEDVQRMCALALEAVEAGALGFSSSRSLNHKASDGTLTPTYAAGADELVAISKGLNGRGVLQIISDFDDIDAEFDIIRRMSEESGQRLSTSVLQLPQYPGRWCEVLERIGRANDHGAKIRAQVSGRPVGVMMGLRFTRQPFMCTTGYRAVAHLPFPERLRTLRDPAVRTRILMEAPGDAEGLERHLLTNFAGMYEFDADGYEPAADRSMTARSAKVGLAPGEFIYDLLTAGNGDAVLYLPAANFVDNRIDAVKAMLSHRDALLGLGDGGAHCGLLCDASLTTYMLQRWSQAGQGHMALEDVIRRLTSDTASAVGLNDRGIIASGYRADLNVIDIERLAVMRPEIVDDLPNGGGRVGQRATGYVATLVKGQVTYREGTPTGALPGRLVRGPQRLAA